MMYFNVLFAAILFSSGGCKAGSKVKNADDKNAANSQNLPIAKKTIEGKPDDEKTLLLRYVYNGPLPSLKNVAIVGSMKGLTVRVSGDLPPEWIEQKNNEKKKDGKTWKDALPFYALIDKEDANPRISVVYPIASTASQLHSLMNRNVIVGQEKGGQYTSVEINPWRTDGGEAYGGFPFIHYGNGFSFHGPVNRSWDVETQVEMWVLQRGYVSHGCKRMQAEHVVEMAHLIGLDMKKVYPRISNETKKWPTFSVDMKMLGMEEFDVYRDKKLDVNYHVSMTPPDWAAKGVAQVNRAKTSLPAAQVFVAPTWDARDFPNFVCPLRPGDEKLKPNTLLPDNYCDPKAPPEVLHVDPRPNEKECKNYNVEPPVPAPCMAILNDDVP